MSTRAKELIATAGAVIAILLTCTGLAARSRESAIRRVRPGVSKAQVEVVLGVGQPDISSDGQDHHWPPERKQFWYRGNPSLWYGRREDTLVVGYTNDVVSDIQRQGL